MRNLIPEADIRRQAVKFYLALLGWPLYLFVLPLAFARLGAFSLLFMVFPGIYLFAWVGYCMHECWHKYVPNIPSNLLYNVYAAMLVTEPQVYRLAHGLHHSQVNTYQDIEFHPAGEIRNRALRILYNWMEVFLGVAFISLVANVTLPRDARFKSRYRAWKLPVAAFSWVLFLGGLGYLAHRTWGATLGQVAIPYALSIWLNSVVLHHSQLVEHGNLIVAGKWEERNVRTRNLRRSGLAERVFLFFTHGDSQEHVLHHTMTPVYARPFPGRFPLPPGALVITMRDYLHVLGDMLLGRDSAQ